MTTVSPPLTLHSWQGRRILALLCAVAFIDFADASITNVALPHILTSLHVLVQSLQWVPSAYLLTYGGFMLVGGRLADLLGRRNVLLTGTTLVGRSSLVGGFAGRPACSSEPASRRGSGLPSPPLPGSSHWRPQTP